MGNRQFSAILLAGGKSSRMGKSKAELIYKGKRFIDIQKEKLIALGIDDIVISGFGEGMLPDEVPDCGPMGGIYSCLKAIKHNAALVLPIDTPLLSVELLADLMHFHNCDVTVLKHGDELEPLIGIYSKACVKPFEELIKAERYSLRRVFPLVQTVYFPYTGPLDEIQNYNTPEDYLKLTNS